MQSRAMKLIQGVSVWEGAEEVQSIIHIKAEKCKNMKHSQDMQLIQKLRDDQKCMKKVFEVMSGRNIVTNSRVTPSWREIVSLTFSEAGVLHVNWISFGHCVTLIYLADTRCKEVTLCTHGFIDNQLEGVLHCSTHSVSVVEELFSRGDLVWLDQRGNCLKSVPTSTTEALLIAIPGYEAKEQIVTSSSCGAHLGGSFMFNRNSSLIPLSHGSFDVIMGMDWLSKRKFVIVCHEKVVRIPLEGDEILRVHGERTQGVVKTLMNTKVEEPKMSDISVVRDFIYVFAEDLSMITTTTS
ncbi:hypothetical protein Tco_0652666 [Tanacetum coccineum]|uniref:Uncharacterized protein n=1 Tax=Tanacetum coccineum TaxID=301880 RepID=A0ABQ4WY69_9ASTR